MAKRTTCFECEACGHTEPKWLGQCPACGAWNTLVERTVSVSPTKGTTRGDGRIAVPLTEVATGAGLRLSTGLAELDRALGGGLVRGSTVLIGGEPGIGKSTLMLQMAGSVSEGRAPMHTWRGAADATPPARADSADAAARSVVYVSAEESASQVRARADRLGVNGAAIQLVSTARAELVLAELDRHQPQLVIVDSVQTMLAEEAGSVPGTTNQVKLVTHLFSEWARATGACVAMVAHVTKDGQIAGPKVVEHMVDAVLLFEQSGGEVRFLRATKNRFGAIEEVGIFTMGETGLSELADPGGVFLAGGGERPPGVVAAPCYEGSRVLVVEIQALTVAAKGAMSRTFSDRIDMRRVTRVAAVLERHVGTPLSDQDIYVNVAGGMRIGDVAIDLPLALALHSARRDTALPAGVMATGELSLAGEVRPVSHLAARSRAARDLGFARLIAPAATRGPAAGGGSGGGLSGATETIETLVDAVAAAFRSAAPGR